jgi:hypothetical protein
MKLIYGKEGQLSFASEKDVYIAIGFLANCNLIRIYEEPNKQRGAYADEWRMSFSKIPANAPQSIKNSIKPNKDGSNPRLNNKEFINELLRHQHGFQLGYTQNSANIRSTIPASFITNFDYGLSL